MLQHVVHKGARLGRLELRAHPRSGLQAVGQEVRETAARKALQPGGGELHVPPVQLQRGLAREAAARDVRRGGHAVQPLGVGALKVFARQARFPAALPRNGGGSQLYGRVLAGEQHARAVHSLDFKAEKPLGARDEKARLRLAPVRAPGGVRNGKRLGGEGDAVIYKRVLAPQLRLARVKRQTGLGQRAALVAGEHAVVPLGRGKALVRGAEDYEVLYVPAAHPVHVARGNHVQRDGYDADVVLRERQKVQPRKGGGVQLHVSQHGGALLQRVNGGVPDARVLGGRLPAPGALQLVRALGQAQGELQRVKKPGERLTVLPRGRGGLDGGLKLHERRGGAAAQLVYAREPLARRIAQLALVAVGVHSPVALVVPAAGGYAPGEAVVLQLVALGQAQPGQTGAQVGKDVALLPATGDGVVGGGDERG